MSTNCLIILLAINFYLSSSFRPLTAIINSNISAKRGVIIIIGIMNYWNDNLKLKFIIGAGGQKEDIILKYYYCVGVSPYE